MGAGPEDVAALRQQAESPVLATVADLPEVAQTLSDAFAVDPLVTWFMRDDARRDAARLSFFKLLINAEALRTTRIDRPAGGGAAACWIASEDLKPTPILEELRGLPAMLAVTGWVRFWRMQAIRVDMERHHPTDRPHAYLWFLGVAPAAQGHGVGSALLRAANTRLDAQGLPAYLETGTTRNVALYERHGYRVLSEHKARADAPTMWSMWREPSAS